MIDFRTLNSFLSDYLANSGMLSFYSEKDRASYSMGTHCYVLCPVCGAKTSSEMIKGTRRFKSWQCGHLSSSSPLDFFMLAEGIKDFPVAVRKAEKLMNSVPFEEKRIYHHKPDDKSLSLRKKNIELAEKAFLESDQMMTAAYLKTRGIDYCSLPEVIRRDIAYSSHIEQISQSTGKRFFISGVIFRNSFQGSVSFTVRRTEGMEYVHSDFRVLQIGKILPFGISGAIGAKTIAVTEGAFDAISLYAAGLSAISISGVANIGKVLNYLPESCSKVIIALDSDEAGETAAFSLAGILTAAGMPSERLRIGKGKDVNEWLCSDPQSFYETLGKEKKQDEEVSAWNKD